MRFRALFLLCVVLTLTIGSAAVVVHVMTMPVPVAQGPMPSPPESVVADAPGANDAANPDEPAIVEAPAPDVPAASSPADATANSPSDNPETPPEAVAPTPKPTAPTSPGSMTAEELAAFMAKLKELLKTDPDAAREMLLAAFVGGTLSPEQMEFLFVTLLDDTEQPALVKVNLALALVGWPADKGMPIPPAVVDAVRDKIMPALREIWNDDTPDALSDQLKRVQLLALVATPEAATFAGEIFAATEEPQLQAVTISTLGQMKTPEANTQLIDILVTDTAAKWRDMTYQTLLQSMDEQTLESLYAVLESPDATAAQTVAAFDLISSTINRQKGGRVAGELDPRLAEAVPRLFEMYGQIDDVNVRRMILSSLGEIAGGDAWVALDAILNGDEANLYLLDAAALNLSIGSGEAHNMLRDVLDSSSARLDSRLVAWKYMGTPQIWPLLKAIGQQPENADALRAQLEQLMGPARELAHLAFAGGTPDQQMLAVQTLAGLPDPQVVDSFLSGLAGNPDPRVALHVGATLIERYSSQPNVQPQLGTTIYTAVEQAVTSGHLNENETMRGLAMLGRTNATAAAPLFAQLAGTTQTDTRVRRMAVAQLIRSKADGYGDLMRQLAERDPDPEIRRLAGTVVPPDK